jgi:DNA-binding NarL/FixJ family response regulator
MTKANNQTTSKVRVMLVDDHSGMRQALRTIIDSASGLTVVAEADSGAAAIQLLPQVNPDVVVMDGSMPTMNGVEATHRLKKRQPHLKIVALTLYEQTTYLEEMVAAGARGYVLKTGSPEHLIKAIETVATGGIYFDPAVPRQSRSQARSRSVTMKLSAKELEVAKLLASGRTNAEIGAALGLTASELEKHRLAVMKKMGLRSRAELVRVATLRRWLDP